MAGDMFGKLEALPPDPILGVTAAFRRDPSPSKVDLGVGVYRDDAGLTPVPAAVREAERRVLAEQNSKTYVGPSGNPEFNERIVGLALGPQNFNAVPPDFFHPIGAPLYGALKRVASINTDGHANWHGWTIGAEYMW